LCPGSNQYDLSSCLKLLLSNVVVVEVCWEAVPNTRPGSSKAPVVKCVVCAWNDARSVGGRAEPASTTFRDQVYVVGQVRRCLARQRREYKACQFEVDKSKRATIQRICSRSWTTRSCFTSCSLTSELSLISEPVNVRVTTGRINSLICLTEMFGEVVSYTRSHNEASVSEQSTQD